MRLLSCSRRCNTISRVSLLRTDSKQSSHNSPIPSSSRLRCRLRCRPSPCRCKVQLLALTIMLQWQLSTNKPSRPNFRTASQLHQHLLLISTPFLRPSMDKAPHQRQLTDMETCTRQTMNANDPWNTTASRMETTVTTEGNGSRLEGRRTLRNRSMAFPTRSAVSTKRANVGKAKNAPTYMSDCFP